jgi:hypothetical protein
MYRQAKTYTELRIQNPRNHPKDDPADVNNQFSARKPWHFFRQKLLGSRATWGKCSNDYLLSMFCAYRLPPWDTREHQVHSMHISRSIGATVQTGLFTDVNRPLPSGPESRVGNSGRTHDRPELRITSTKVRWQKSDDRVRSKIWVGLRGIERLTEPEV